MKKTPKLRGLSDILTYFRRNETPIFFVSPTSFNLLGLEKFVNRFFHINYFDSFDGAHPRVFVPEEKGEGDFQSMEDVCNYMLMHKEVVDRIRKAGSGPAISSTPASTPQIQPLQGSFDRWTLSRGILD